MSNNRQTQPTLNEFCAACRDEFAYLSQYGFSEMPTEQQTEYEVAYTNNKYVIRILGECYGYSARAIFEDINGIEAPLIMFVPNKEREKHKKESNIPGQIADIKIEAYLIKKYCSEVLAGDDNKFVQVANE